MPSTDDKRTRILVVDDEPAIVELISLILDRQGYQTASAANGALAVEAARSFRPHCVITDVLMPVMDGVEVAMRMKEMMPECKVLLITGEIASGDLLQQARAKGYQFPLLTKPMYPTDLLREVAAQLAPSRVMALPARHSRQPQ